MQQTGQMVTNERRFGRVNWLGLYTLAQREVLRFLNVWTQTVLAPLVTAGLFMLIFTIAIGPRRGDVMGVDFTTFIAPGILMMTVIQNAFANTSSSIVISKVQGNIVDTLMPPLSAGELVLGYLAGGVARGLLVAVVIVLALWVFLGIVPQNPLVALFFVIVGAALLSGIGMVAGIFADKFDQMAAITNFIVTPLAFLSGTFYSVEALPPIMYDITHANPIFYLIDGVRWGIIGVSDSSPRFGRGHRLGQHRGHQSAGVVIFPTWIPAEGLMRPSRHIRSPAPQRMDGRPDHGYPVRADPEDDEIVERCKDQRGIEEWPDKPRISPRQGVDETGLCRGHQKTRSRPARPIAPASVRSRPRPLRPTR